MTRCRCRCLSCCCCRCSSLGFAAFHAAFAPLRSLPTLSYCSVAVFNCFSAVYLLFIYVSFHLHCLFSVAYAALSIRLMRSSAAPALALALADYYVFCMQSALPTAAASDKQRNRQTERRRDRRTAHKQGARHRPTAEANKEEFWSVVECGEGGNSNSSSSQQRV